jgi:hypothetical protein
VQPSQPNRTSHVPAPAPVQAQAPSTNRASERYDNDEVSDDLLAALENEIDDHDLGDDDDINDPEMDKINKHLNSLMPNIKKAIPKEHQKRMELDDDDLGLDDGFDQHVEMLMIKDGSNNRASQQAQAANRQSKVGPPKVQLPPIVPQVKQANKKPVSKELGVILERQRLFKEAAVQAKREGNTNVALVYLRHAKVKEKRILK